MQHRFMIVLLFLVADAVYGQTERERAMIPLNDYMIGTSYNYPQQIQKAFIDSAKLHLNREGDPWVVDPATYAALFENRPAGQFNGRESQLLSLTIHQDIAQAEIEVVIPGIEARFIDLLLLKKFGEDWKVISKSATRYPLHPPFRGAGQKVIMEGLKKPWSMAFIDAEQALVAEKDGDLLRVNLRTQERTTITGFPEDLFTPLQLDVSKYPEGTYPARADGRTVRFNAGILEVLVDPEFAVNSRIYISYVAQKGDTYALKVIRATLQEDRLTAVETLLNPGPYVPGLFHFGGGMTIGPDGKLYITAGERLFFEYLKDGLAIAQDLKDERGKIYRLNLDGSIPGDNPDFGPEAVKGMYALGIRAAQGITNRPNTDQIWFSEHGTVQGDEVNLLSPGANYGWPNVTSGKYRSENYQPAEVPGAVFTDPVHFWQQTVAPTGLVFYSGSKFPAWRDNLIVPGLSRGSLWRMVLDGNVIKSAEELFLDQHVRLRKAEMSPDGKLYILTSEENGKIIEVVPIGN